MLRKLSGILFAAIIISTLFIAQAMAMLDSVEIIYPERGIRPKSTVIFKARAYDENGRDITSKTIFIWACDNPDAGVISVNGRFSAKTLANLYESAISVTATYGTDKITEYADVEVSPGDPVKLIISDDNTKPQQDGIIVVPNGGSTTLCACVTDVYGNTVGFIETHGWALLNPKAGALSEFYGNWSRQFDAGTAEGKYTNAVCTIFRGRKYYATIIVSPPPPDRVEVYVSGEEVQEMEAGAGTKVKFTAKAYDINGNEVKGIEFSYSAWPDNLPQTEFGKIDAKTGVFTAGTTPGATGYINVCPAVNGHSYGEGKDVSINIVPGPPKKVVVTPAYTSFCFGAEMDYAVKVYDAYNNEIPDPEIIWTLSNPSIGTIDATGHFVAGDAPGIYKKGIKATAIAGSSSATGYANATIFDELTEADKTGAIKALSNIQLSETYNIWDPVEKTSSISNISTSIGYWANGFGYMGANPTWQPESTEASAQELMAQTNLARTTYSINDIYENWHWTGKATYTSDINTPISLSIKGTTRNRDTASVSFDTDKGTLNLAVRMRRDDGKLFEGTLTNTITGDKYRPDNASAKAVFKLNNKLVLSEDLDFTINEDGESMTMNGTKTTAAADGYYVTAKTDSLVIPSIYAILPMFGTITFTTSDKFTGTITLADDTWTGQVYNAKNRLVANITGSTEDKSWTLNFTDETESEPISYYPEVH